MFTITWPPTWKIVRNCNWRVQIFSRGEHDADGPAVLSSIGRVSQDGSMAIIQPDILPKEIRIRTSEARGKVKRVLILHKIYSISSTEPLVALDK